MKTNSTSPLPEETRAASFSARAVRFASFLALPLLFLCGCASERPSACRPVGRPSAVGLGTIGVAPSDRPVHVWFHGESKGASACRGAKDAIANEFTSETAGAGMQAAAGAGPGAPFIFAPFLATMIVKAMGGAVGGLIGGAAKGVPKELAQQAEGTFREAAPREEFRGQFHKLIGDASRQQTTGEVVLLRWPRWLESRPQGVNTILQADYLGIGLHNVGASARLELRATGYAQLVRTSSNEQIDSCLVEYRSGLAGTRKLAEWAANDAQLLREELERCQHHLASQVVAKLLGESQKIAKAR